MKKPMIDLKVGISGYYKIEKIKDGRRVTVADWFPNLITNNGLDLFGSTNQKMSSCFVGAGNATPLVTNTQLQSLIAEDDMISATETGLNTTDHYSYARRSYQFNAGTATGNISEVGVGSGSTNLLSRALVVDSGGSPITITVLADEILIVTYELRLYQPLTDINTSVDGYTIVLRAADINSAFGWNSILNAVAMQGASTRNAAKTGAISSVTSMPSGTSYSAVTSTDSYVPGSYSRTGELYFNISNANNTLTAFTFCFDAAGGYQFSVSPSIVKTGDDELRVGVMVTWAREGELP